jgi:hypothetical protein
MSLTSNPGTESEDLPQEEVEASKRKSRTNALILAAIFAIITLAPDPYKFFAPLLFLIPLILSLIKFARKASNGPELQIQNLPNQPEMPKPSSSDPYTYKPKDPQDPRNYKPIG